NEPKHLFEEDFTTSFIKTTTSSTKIKGMRIPEYLLNDKIKKSLNYKLYDNAYKGVQEEATIKTRSKGGVKSGSTTSTTGSPHTRSKAPPMSKPKTSTTPKPTSKPKPATKPKKKVTPEYTLRDEPTPPPSDTESEFDTESEEEEPDYELRYRAPEEGFSATEIAVQQSLETYEEETRRRKGVTINEPNDDEDEPIVEPLVDKRKLKSIVVDTRAEEKRLLKEQRKASLESRLLSHPPTPPPIDQSEHEGATSSMVPPTTSEQPHNLMTTLRILTRLKMST
ncbi:MAG: hypothetical protein J6586_07730, partial [Snodgrassella sp.]|nr:hypothetical protein [Snodgrassella sp.]